MRVRVQRPHKKTIIMCICKNNAYWLAVMDQDADSVWVMTLNYLVCKYTFLKICIIVTQTLISKYIFGK